MWEKPASSHQFMKVLKVDIFMCRIVIMACLWSCRHRKAKINPQDTRSALHFRMPDKQQHLVTFWCSYGDLTPCSVLHHAGGSSRHEHDVHWNSEGTVFSCSNHRTPMQRWWFSMWKASDSPDSARPWVRLFLAYHPQLQTLCRSVWGWRWWWWVGRWGGSAL